MTEIATEMTPARREALEHVTEECGEIVQACMKAARHGFDSVNPEEPGATNLEAIADEIGDLLAAIDILEYNLDWRRPGTDWFRGRIRSARVAKLRHVSAYMHHADVAPVGWAIP
jgi:hypothetical protein